MADFTIWGCAIAEALGYTRKEFLDAYFSNLEVQNKEVLYENLVAATLLSFMDGKSDWNGTPTELLEELQNSDENQKIVNQKGFPKAANILSRRINELRTNLAEAGMYITRDDGKQRIINITYKQEENTDDTVNSVNEENGSTMPNGNDNDDKDDNDGISADKKKQMIDDAKDIFGN